jgi:hypothetical protein
VRLSGTTTPPARLERGGILPPRSQLHLDDMHGRRHGLCKTTGLDIAFDEHIARRGWMNRGGIGLKGAVKIDHRFQLLDIDIDLIGEIFGQFARWEQSRQPAAVPRS